MASKLTEGNDASTARERSQLTSPSVLATLRRGVMRCGVDRIVHFAARPFLVALGLLAAMPVQAQMTPAISESIDSPDGTPDARPKITITADRDTIYGNLEDLRLVLKREKAGEALTVKLWLQQDEDWLKRRTQTRYVYFYPQDTVAVMKVHRSQFDPDITESGCIVVKVVEAPGYSISKAKAPVWIISVPAPVVTLSLNRVADTFAEDGGQATQQLVARMTLGMPRGVEVAARIGTRGKGSSKELSATAGEDFESVSRTVVIPEDAYELQEGWWVARADLSLGLFDDDMREGTETFELTVQPPSDQSEKVQFLNSNGTRCWGRCKNLMHITDDEGVPAMKLSVSADEIMEEGETSSTAMVSITDGTSFEGDQLVTLSLDGTATMGADYVVSPADADAQAAEYQVVLPGQSTSTEVTIKAMSDEIDDPDEKIEVSAALDGDPIGDMRAIRIMNQEVVLPRITLSANRDNIIAGLEDLELTLTREGPLDESLRLTVQLTQDQRWIPFASCPVTFGPGEATATATLRRGQFSGNVVESGNLTAAVQAIDGFDVHDASASVFVVSQQGPAIRVLFNHDVYRFAEDSKDPLVILVAQAASGMSRGTTVRFAAGSRSGTAGAGDDFASLSEEITLREEDFAFENGLWQAKHRLPLTLLDDDVREGTERFDLLLRRVQGHPDELQLSAFSGAPCQGVCATPVEIADGEDTPVLEFSVKPLEIREEDKSSSTATVAIANGKTFAADQAVTFVLAGTADEGIDYEVAPSDADSQASGHQVVLAAGSSSAGVNLTARDDNSSDPGEKIEISAVHDGNAIGSGVVRIVDGARGPTLKVTFEGVGPPKDGRDAGIATGPFTTHFAFSEPVEGFTQDDIRWSTLAWTTHDSTLIGLILSDFTEVRPGLEYSVVGMPTKSGRLSVGADEGAAYAVTTGAASEWGTSSLWIDLPANVLMVWPRSLTVREGDAKGDEFVVVLSSEPTSTVSVDLTGTEGTAVKANNSLPLTFSTSDWSVARGVTIVAGADANARDETVALQLAASGGGYGGQTATVVVKVRDSQAGSAGAVGGDVNDEAAALILVENVTAEAAAAALLGEEVLNAAQLAALDRLGNENGSYDLGDLLSWVVRCRRGEARCGGVPGNVAALAASGLAGRTGHRNQQDSGSGGRSPSRRRSARGLRRFRQRTGSPVRRRSRAAGYGLALLLAASMTWACADDVMRPVVERDPGYLTVSLTVPPDARDMGAMLLVEGPGIDAIEAPDFELFESGTSSSRRIIVSGPLSTGPVLKIQVPDRGDLAEYRVRLLEVSGEDYTLRDLAAYRAAISR